MNQIESISNPTSKPKAALLTLQQKKLLPRLMSSQGLTALEASIHFGITSLHRRLFELEQLGCVIESKPEKSQTARYNRYFAVTVPSRLRKELGGC